MPRTLIPPAGALFVSPHLDDAVLGCGELIASAARAAVVTLFAGCAPPGHPLTEWDRAAGFSAGEDVVAARREEDREALALLGAAAHWLDFLDEQYGGRDAPTMLATALERFIGLRPCEALFVPAGFFHHDHQRASDACRALLDGRPALPAFLYEEPMYRRVEGVREARLGAWTPWATLEPVAFALADGAATRKRDALACYRSQLRALGARMGYDDAFDAERYWQVHAA